MIDGGGKRKNERKEKKRWEGGREAGDPIQDDRLHITETCDFLPVVDSDSWQVTDLLPAPKKTKEGLYVIFLFFFFFKCKKKLKSEKIHLYTAC